MIPFTLWYEYYEHTCRWIFLLTSNERRDLSTFLSRPSQAITASTHRSNHERPTDSETRSTAAANTDCTAIRMRYSMGFAYASPSDGHSSEPTDGELVKARQQPPSFDASLGESQQHTSIGRRYQTGRCSSCFVVGFGTQHHRGCSRPLHR